MTMLRVVSAQTQVTKYYLNGRRCTHDRWYDQLAEAIRAGTYNSSFTLRSKRGDYHYCHG